MNKLRARSEAAGGEPARRPARARAGRVEIVVIGASTGGPNALAEIVPALPADFPVPVVVAQHMPPLFTRRLAERLAAVSAVGVTEAADGESLRPGHVWVAPGDCHARVVRGPEGVRLELRPAPRGHVCRPSVDALFRSAAESYRAGVLAVVLTGMGRDGLRGCEAVRDGGGTVFVQDEPTSVVWGMPGAVARSGLADRILPLGVVGRAIADRARDRRPTTGL